MLTSAALFGVEEPLALTSLVGTKTVLASWGELGLLLSWRILSSEGLSQLHLKVENSK